MITRVASKWFVLAHMLAACAQTRVSVGEGLCAGAGVRCTRPDPLVLAETPHPELSPVVGVSERIWSRQLPCGPPQEICQVLDTQLVVHESGTISVAQVS